MVEYGSGGGEEWDNADGRHVAFLSLADNLVANDNNGVADVFVRDLVLNTTVLASAGATLKMYLGPPYYSSSYLLSPPAITPDGRYVTFATSLGGLVPGMTAFPGDVFVRDLAAKQTIWASSNASTLARAILGGTYYPPSIHPEISDDGMLVTFKTGLAAAAVIFQYNMTNGVTTTVYTNAPFYSRFLYVPPPPDDCYGPEMTPDGRVVAFVAMEGATNQGTNGRVRLRDSETGPNVLVFVNTNGVYSTGTLSQAPVVTPDGRYVVFLSNAGDLTSNADSNGFHVFLRDLLAETTAMLDVDTHGAGSADFSGMDPSLTTNGQLVAFSGPDAGLAPPVSPGGNVTLVWSAAAGRTYSVQYKDSLNDPVWQALSGNATINGNQGQFTVPADLPSRYYRIVVQ